MSILQWNMQIYRTKFVDLKVILNEYAPACMCLQETMIGNKIAHPPSGYLIQTSVPKRQDDHERGTAILVSKQNHYEPLSINTNLQATAIRIFIGKYITVCSLYLPHIPFTYDEMAELIDQLPHPLLLMGDFNAKSAIWGPMDVNTDNRGKIIERLLLNYPITTINNHSPTYVQVHTNSESTIDLTISSSTIHQELEYNITDSLCNSDHYPIHVKILTAPQLIQRPARFNTDKANWKLFERETENVVDVAGMSVEQCNEIFVNTIIEAAKTAIHMKRNHVRKPPVPW